jgi:hypothetical protein
MANTLNSKSQNGYFLSFVFIICMFITSYILINIETIVAIKKLAADTHETQNLRNILYKWYRSFILIAEPGSGLINLPENIVITYRSENINTDYCMFFIKGNTKNSLQPYQFTATIRKDNKFQTIQWIQAVNKKCDFSNVIYIDDIILSFRLIEMHIAI